MYNLYFFYKMKCFFVLFIMVMGVAAIVQAATITGVTIDPAITSAATGSDTWPITWADDDNLYTAYGDGNGFNPKVPSKLSLGFAKVSQGPASFSATNIRSSSGEQIGDGASGKKASGMLMVNGVIYMWVRNADNAGHQSQLAWSNDHMQTWTWATWKFEELGYCCFLNFGQHYAGARDTFVYVYSPNTTSAYDETDEVVLARVSKNRISVESAYEFVSGFDVNGVPQWSSNIANRTAVFTLVGGCNRLDVVYNIPLQTYIMVMRSRARVGGLNQFSIYTTQEPWGPWSQIYYTTPSSTSNGWPGEAQHFPAKWISSDGRTLYMVSSANDAFSVQRVDLIVQQSTVAMGRGTERNGTIVVHPNPFNSTAVIMVHGALSTRDCRVFDVHGRMLEILALPQSASQVTWNASGFPSGEYIIVLTSENVTTTKRLFLMK